MKPVIDNNKENALISVKLFPEMSREGIKEFSEEFEEIVEGYKTRGVSFAVINDAAQKSFESIDAVRDMSQGLRRILNTELLLRCAVYRPQNDYASDDEKTDPHKFRSFVDLDEAKRWIGEG